MAAVREVLPGEGGSVMASQTPPRWATPLPDYIANAEWLIGCTCPWKWANYGTVYGISMGEGWVRASTDAECPQHKHGGLQDQRYAAWLASREAR
jgi:hypothetical protein